MTAATTEQTEERISDIDVTDEMRGSFLEYAYSVIYARALPDARDGLKPVQRRILYQMAEMGLRPDRSHVKSARVVGEVMGKLHPHGDSAIYDALVRMAQAFTLRLPLVDGHGNFGSLDDGPAAARYTEARLTAPALSMTDGLDEDVVNFVPNYDNKLLQPEVLPSAFPNLLVNGASGIAVGMATNIAPHNLGEVIAAARYLITNPNATLSELMDFVPGPDLPTGGTIVGLSGVRDSYTTGRGSFRIRSKVTIEAISARRTAIVVTELPYLVGPERVIEKIKDGINSKRITGISDVTDLTDRHKGLRLVIGIKTGFNPDAVLEQLYRFTPLAESFSINSVALVDGKPQTLSLRELLQVYVDHRMSVVTRRSQFRLNQKQQRLHLVDGLLIAIVDIDEVIQLIRRSDNTAAAKTGLIKVFDLSGVQAEYILELQLRRLTKFSRIELERERNQLHAELAELEQLLSNRNKIATQVSTELADISAKHSTPRRTLLLDSDDESSKTANAAKPKPLKIADVACRVFLSTSGQLLRVDLADTQLNPPAVRSKHDAILSTVNTTTRSDIGVITNHGRLIRTNVVALPAAPASSIQLTAGVRADSYLNLGDKTEQAIALVSLASTKTINLGTRNGVVKRVTPDSYPKAESFSVINLKANDQVVGASQSDDNAELVFVSSDAQLLRFPATAVRPQGVTAGGMAGINLAPGAHVLFFGSISSLALKPEPEVIVVTIATQSNLLLGRISGKLSSFRDFPAKGRATGGVRAQRFRKGETELALAWVGSAPALAVLADGNPTPMSEQFAKRDASGEPIEGQVYAIGGQIT